VNWASIHWGAQKAKKEPISRKAYSRRRTKCNQPRDKIKGTAGRLRLSDGTLLRKIRRRGFKEGDRGSKSMPRAEKKRGISVCLETL